MGLSSRRILSCLVFSTALGGAQAGAQCVSNGAFEEIVVTATKRSEVLSRVPLSISAFSQETLDKTGVRVFSDVVRTVPSLAMQASAIGDRNPAISIRGIASSSGAQTTGIYIDDTPLQKRNAIGISGSGTPIPQLFDLERVEVLKGPQGTLFGGSSMGGTIRMITPTPSLDTWSTYGRAEVGSVKSGGVSYQGGAAVGGPLIADKLGARISGYARRTAGYIDHVDRYTGDVLEKDTNSGTGLAFRAAFLLQASENVTVMPAVYYGEERQHDADSQWATIPSVTRNGYTYPEYKYDSYQNGNNCNIGADFAATSPTCVNKQPRNSKLFVPSLKIEIETDVASITSVSSYIYDRTAGAADYSYSTPVNFQAGYPFVHNLSYFWSSPVYENTRKSYTQELRAASNNEDSRLSWVFGLFYAHSKNNSNYNLVTKNYEGLTMALLGRTPEEQYGVPLGPDGISYHRDQDLKETSFAGFGEVNFKVTEQLKLLAGIRVSREKFTYDQYTAGMAAGFLIPTVANGGLTNGTLKATPVTPRFGIQYQATEETMLYATASKGYRVGGVNQPPPAARCAADLTALGIDATPETYGADSLWSYELGAKGRALDDRVTFSASGFYINWTGIQTDYALPTCSFGYVINGGKAVSKGVSLEGTVRLLDSLVLNGQFAYTNAQYTESVIGPEPRNTLFVQDGDRLPVPRYTLNIGAEYNFSVGEMFGFIRADYQYSSSYQQSSGPGTSTFNADTWYAEAADYMSARAGISRDGWEVSMFVDNIFNSKDVLGANGGRSGCAAGSGAACTTYARNVLPLQYVTQRPRTIGLTVTFR